MRGLLSGSGEFPNWIRELMTTRARLDPNARIEAFEAGAAELLQSGCTWVGDVDGSGIARERDATLAPRILAYRETIDVGDAQRRDALLLDCERSAQAGKLKAVSPHAPYTVSPELLLGIGRLVHEYDLAVGVHWAETEAERDWLEHGTGAFAELLAPMTESPRTSGLGLLQSAELLGPRTALYHGNHPTRAEIDAVAASGASIVHCPGSHRFFERESFPFEAWRAAGVPVALGTDSLASQTALDMRAEMRLFRQTHPEISPNEVFRMATEHAARALGCADQAGSLELGRVADFAHFETRAESLESVLEEFTSGEGALTGVWLSGERAFGGDAA